jgi:predicted acyltransferase
MHALHGFRKVPFCGSTERRDPMTPEATLSDRLVSLDAFRGITIALMILVNTPGDAEASYWPLKHADWHGWTPTDVVFPSFLWIAGVALTIAFERRLAAGATRKRLFLQTGRRALILYAIGLLLCGFPLFDLATLRWMGVLQRIAICTLVGSAIWLTTAVWGRVGWILGLLATYWALMMLVPVPGYGAGRLDVDGNLAHYVDRIVLGAHNWTETKTWDPEGCVSTLPALATFLFGTLAGTWLRDSRPLTARLAGLAAAGAALVAVGLVCDHWLPINKKIWTTSFAIFMAGLDCVLYAVMAWLIDVRGWRRPVRPFAILGMNSIAVYVASELLDPFLSIVNVRDWIYERAFVPLASAYNASLLYAIAYTVVMLGLAWILYRQRLFIRV